MKTLKIYIDEAGRGPLAGPLSLGLILPLKRFTKKELSTFCDSKKLSEKKREDNFELIQKLQQQKKLFAVNASVSSKEIDRYGMTIAQNVAISRGLIQIFRLLVADITPQIEEWMCKIDIYSMMVLKNILDQHHRSYENMNVIFSLFQKQFQIQFKLIIDGNKDFWLKKTFPLLQIETIVDGDDKVKEIWMASIIAKVSRDRVMNTLPKKYEKYEFVKHKGYGTSLHKSKIEKYGPSDIHRKLFLKKLFPNHTIQKKLPKYL